MKKQSLFLLLCSTFSLILSLTFGSISQAAPFSCAELFEVPFQTQTTKSTFTATKNSGDILLDMFGLILKAPNHSKVKIFTKNISSDGIGALLLLVSVHESSLARGLQFEFYLEEGSNKFRIHDLYTENSSNKIRFKDTAENEFSNKTIVIVESPNSAQDGIRAMEFDGDLMSKSMKDSSQRGAIPVSYGGTSVLRASPFKTIGVNEEQVDISKLNTEAYTLDKTTPINMNSTDMIMINSKAADLALQLYMLKKNQVPKKVMSSLEILKELLH